VQLDLRCSVSRCEVIELVERTTNLRKRKRNTLSTTTVIASLTNCASAKPGAYFAGSGRAFDSLRIAAPPNLLNIREHFMRHRVAISAFAVSCAAVAVSSAVNAGTVRADVDELVPTGKGWGERPAPGPGPGEGAGQGQGQPQGNGKPNRPSGGNGIDYHGGPLILGTTNVYYIWYGNWSGNNATTILTDLANGIGGSPYFNINTTYYNGSNTHVANAVHYAGSTTDNYSQGTSLSDTQIQTVVSSAIASGKVTKDPNAVYFVLTAQDVTAS
jgi:hypothetical protein